LQNKYHKNIVIFMIFVVFIDGELKCFIDTTQRDGSY